MRPFKKKGITLLTALKVFTFFWDELCRQGDRRRKEEFLDECFGLLKRLLLD